MDKLSAASCAGLEEAAKFSSQATRVTLFAADLRATGVARNAIAIANRLALKGMPVSLVLCHAAGELSGEVDPRVELVGLLDRRTNSLPRSLRLVLSLVELCRHIRRGCPDVLLSTGNHGHLLCAAASLAGPVRTVFRISNDLDHVKGERSADPLRRLLRSIQLRIVARRAHALVFVSEELARSFLMSRVRTRAIVETILNGVDRRAAVAAAARECDHPWLQGPGAPVVLAVGRLAAQKNFETLLEALAIARRTMDLRLILIGGGADRRRQALEDRARRLGLTEAVEFVPPVANRFPDLSRAAAFVLPSWWEGSSNVLLEALACGTPIVASHRAGNARMVLGRGRYGALVDPADAYALAEAMIRQVGPDALMPADRASAFDRSKSLDAYAHLLKRVTSQRADSCQGVAGSHGLDAVRPVHM